MITMHARPDKRMDGRTSWQ